MPLCLPFNGFFANSCVNELAAVTLRFIFLPETQGFVVVCMDGDEVESRLECLCCFGGEGDVLVAAVVSDFEAKGLDSVEVNFGVVVIGNADDGPLEWLIRQFKGADHPQV